MKFHFRNFLMWGTPTWSRPPSAGLLVAAPKAWREEIKMRHKRYLGEGALLHGIKAKGQPFRLAFHP